MKIITISLIVLVLMVLITGCSGKPPTEQGLRNGRLALCPSKPNCVSTMAEKTAHAVSPISYKGAREGAVADSKAILQKMAKATVREATNEYIWAEFKSALFGFVDDVEFYFPKDRQVIHIRSASRVGYYDFGVNRKRVEKIRKLMHMRRQM